MSQSNPLLSFYSEQPKTCSLYIFLKFKIRNFASKLVRDIHTFKKKVSKIFRVCFLTVYRVRGAVCGGNFTQIEVYSSTVKNRRKCVTVFRRVGAKGLTVPVTCCYIHCSENYWIFQGVAD